jgi:hypothetical protein
MGAVENLCSSGILLKDGKIESVDSPQKIVQKYLEINKSDTFDFKNLVSIGSKHVLFDSIEFFNESGDPIVFNGGQLQILFLSSLEIRIRLRAPTGLRDKVYVAMTNDQ